jgi:phosphatidate cytidylyltransferase
VGVRALSSIAVVLVGLIPVAIGGPVFALLMLGLGLAAWREYLALAALATGDALEALAGVGAAVIGLFALSALLLANATALFALVWAALFAPLAISLRRQHGPGIRAWATLAAGALYLGLPVYAAVATRGLSGSITAAWAADAAQRLAIAWDASPRGLAWTLLVVLATWIGDTAAYLIGRAFGRRKLAPLLSPNKTIEGSLGGLAGAAVVGALVFVGFGLGVWWLGAVVGAIVGVAGQIGDLFESFLKRQAGVKDSGALIPGHGGVLDRIDALLFAFPAGFLVATLLEGRGA